MKKLRANCRKLCIMIRVLIVVAILASVSVFLLVPRLNSLGQPVIQQNISQQNSSQTASESQGQPEVRGGRIIAREPSLVVESRAALRCGRPVNPFSARIVDGKIGSIAEFPWIVSLQREKSYWFGYKYYKHACGGSLITPSWIVTASHCLYNKEYPKRVVAGTDNLNFMYRAQLRLVERVILHPDFDTANYDNDVALIKVNRPFNIVSQFSLVRPICLEPGIPVLPYDIATIAGFGSKSYRGQTETHLYKADIAIIDRGLCNKSFDEKITRNMICAGGMIPNKRDACSGDSGGPLQMDVDDHESLIGVVSFGNDCATKGYPGIYTRLNNYYSWILGHLDERLLDP